jgi:hypothetical protein
MKKLSAVLCAVLFAIAVNAQEIAPIAAPPLTIAPTVAATETLTTESIWQQFGAVWQKWLKGEGEWSFMPFASYAPSVKKKYGGGLGAFYQVNDYTFVGCRLEWLDGGFFAVAGEAGLKLPIKPLPRLFPNFVVTPFGFIGGAIPISGATVGDWTVPGTVHSYSGTPLGIVGTGAAVTVWKNKAGTLSIGGLFDIERWQELGNQYRMSATVNVKF